MDTDTPATPPANSAAGYTPNRTPPSAPLVIGPFTVQLVHGNTLNVRTREFVATLNVADTAALKALLSQ